MLLASVKGRRINREGLVLIFKNQGLRRVKRRDQGRCGCRPQSPTHPIIPWQYNIDRLIKINMKESLFKCKDEKINAIIRVGAILASYSHPSFFF